MQQNKNNSNRINDEEEEQAGDGTMSFQMLSSQAENNASKQKAHQTEVSRQGMYNRKQDS